ncbi:MAG: peptide chain release factor-like protein [Candidatus Omnitrophota bacterium]|nr:peptide chain release factor-like protein [Candidatus Omnitrophota bacterium]
MKYGVSLRKETELKKKMRRFGVKEKDIAENFVRSSGRGGQNVNKVATCVYLKHNPTGIEVKCKQARTQGLNRFLARRILVEKIETKILGKLSSEKQRIEKIRRQKRKRSKKSKEKMLADKKKQTQIKNLRKKISVHEE